MARSTAKATTSEKWSFETSRFGKITLKEEDIILFPEGLIGLADCRRFALVPQSEDKDGLFFWLQSLEEPTLAMPVTDPAIFCPDYKINAPTDDFKSLQLKNEEDAIVMAVVTIAPSPLKEIWLNLQGPIVVNKRNQLAKQLVLPDSKYSLRHKVSF